MFTLAEEIFLLALLEKKETLRIPSSLAFPFALAGATVIELVISGVVQVEDGRLFLLTERKNVDRGYQLAVIEKLQKMGKTKKVDYWVFQIGARGNRIVKLMMLSLIERGILQEDGKNIYWGPAANSDSQDPMSSKYLLKRRLRDAIFCQDIVDEPTAALLGLMSSCEMLNHLFTEDEMIAGRKRVKRLVKGDGLSSSFLAMLTQITAGVEYAICAAVSV